MQQFLKVIFIATLMTFYCKLKPSNSSSSQVICDTMTHTCCCREYMKVTTRYQNSKALVIYLERSKTYGARNYLGIITEDFVYDIDNISV